MLVHGNVDSQNQRHLGKKHYVNHGERYRNIVNNSNQLRFIETFSCVQYIEALGLHKFIELFWGIEVNWVFFLINLKLINKRT